MFATVAILAVTALLLGPTFANAPGPNDAIFTKDAFAATLEGTAQAMGATYLPGVSTYARVGLGAAFTYDVLSQGADRMYAWRTGQPIPNFDLGRPFQSAVYGSWGGAVLGPIGHAFPRLIGYPGLALGLGVVGHNLWQGKYEHAALNAIPVTLGAWALRKQIAQDAGWLGKRWASFRGWLWRGATPHIGPRGRHHTDEMGLEGIQRDMAINPSRGTPQIGVDVEIEPFGTTAPGLGGPRARTGAAGEGAYVEFDLPHNAYRTPWVSHTQPTARVPTNGPLPLNGLNPEFVNVRAWWNLWYFWK